MNIDVATIAAKSHQYNQDYALKVNTQVVHNTVIVCDGCSGTPHSDLAARYMAFLMSKYASVLWEIPKCDLPIFSRRLAEFMMQRIDHYVFDINVDTGIGRQFPPSSLLDATAVMAIVRKDRVRILVYGDGCFSIGYKNGVSNKYKVEAENGFPPYMSYLVDDRRMQLLKNEKDSKLNIIMNGVVLEAISSRIFKWPAAIMDIPLDTLKYVMVCTDGVESIQGTNWIDIMRELVDFKSVKGGFMQRRLRAMMNKYAVSKQVNTDDLTVGIIHFGD